MIPTARTRAAFDSVAQLSLRNQWVVLRPSHNSDHADRSLVGQAALTQHLVIFTVRPDPEPGDRIAVPSAQGTPFSANANRVQAIEPLDCFESESGRRQIGLPLFKGTPSRASYMRGQISLMLPKSSAGPRFQRRLRKTSGVTSPRSTSRSTLATRTSNLVGAVSGLDVRRPSISLRIVAASWSWRLAGSLRACSNALSSSLVIVEIIHQNVGLRQRESIAPRRIVAQLLLRNQRVVLRPSHNPPVRRDA
jgi:hypothetical protein